MLDVFPSRALDVAYQCFCAALMYFLPLFAIVFSYLNIVLTLCTRTRRMTSINKSRSSAPTDPTPSAGAMTMRIRFPSATMYFTQFRRVDHANNDAQNHQQVDTVVSLERDRERLSNGQQRTVTSSEVSPDVVDLRIANDVGQAERAASRTLKMTVIIVVAFLLCWTPYEILHIW
jgi:hypothetical protein